MACQVTITSVVGVASGGATADSVRVDGTATDCKEVRVDIDCASGQLTGLAPVVAGAWTIEFTNVGQIGCACGDVISVIVTCPDGGCADKGSFDLQCSQCCPMLGLSASSECQPNGTRLVTLIASINLAAGCGPITVRWDFGDGTTSPSFLFSSSTTFAFAHAYPGSGLYTALLQVLSPGGCPPASIQVGSSTPCPAATCHSITSLTTSVQGCAGAGSTALVSFTGTLDAPAPGCTFHWQFGDGTPEVDTTVPSTTHGYTQAGTYAVAVTVVCGTCIRTTTVNVVVEPCCPEIRDVQCSVQCSDRDPTRAVVTCVVTTDPSGAGGVFTWDFGDGSPGQTTSAPSVTHTFMSPGEYDVSVALDPDQEGCGSTGPETTHVSVNCRPRDDDDGGGGFDWCFVGRASIIILLILAMIALYIAICVPGAALPGGVTAAGLGLAAAILIAIWLLTCDQPCSWGLLFAWQVSLGAGIGALYFAACCPELWTIGIGLIAAGLGGLAWWRRRCRASRCDVLRELIIVFSGVILPVLGWIAGISVLQACLTPWIAAAVSSLSALFTGWYLASCSNS